MNSYDLLILGIGEGNKKHRILTSFRDFLVRKERVKKWNLTTQQMYLIYCMMELIDFF